MNTKEDKKSCFVISPIGEPDSDTRTRADQVLEFIIKPVLEKRGYSCTRADEIDKSGDISNQVLDRVLGDDLVIADLSEFNPNVFYELGVRHSFHKPFIHLMDAGLRVPFDVARHRTIPISHRDLRIAAAAKISLDTQIREIEADPGHVDSPLSQAADVQVLRSSSDPSTQSTVAILNGIESLDNRFDQMAHRLGRLEARQSRLSVPEDWEARRQTELELAMGRPPSDSMTAERVRARMERARMERSRMERLRAEIEKNDDED